MGAVEVVVGEVAVEFALEAAEAQVEEAGEGGSPALVEDRLVQRLDGTVGLRPAGLDARLARSERGERVGEGAAKLAAVVGEDTLEPPAGGPQLGGDAAGEP